MTDREDFLFELGTEELPPKSLDRLSGALAQAVAQKLDALQLEFLEIERYASPRRLGLLISGLQMRQTDREMERRGPALQAAFDPSGKPTRAAEGFARSCKTTVEQLERMETDKGSWLVARIREAGRPAEALLPALLEEALAGLPVAKRMRWGDGEVEFVRPVHWLVMLLGDKVIESRIFGLQAGRETRGHRFMGESVVTIDHPSSYEELLEQHGKVIAHFAKRKDVIRNQLQESAALIDARVVIDEDLLNEVTALVEWPVAITGSFEERFLAVPAEALISTMSSNQKYFHLLDADGQLLPRFITISNIDSTEPDWIRAGNERVIRPRFEDAAFFYQKDLAHGLAAHAQGLDRLVFEAQLGSVGDRVRRMQTLVHWLADRFKLDATAASRAAELCKCDLLTEMVGEFPDLQGVMGRYYARAGGEPDAVAEAIAEHYLPRGAGDSTPATDAGRLLALADRLDLLAGIFGIGKGPTGDKDPFGLRRAALGIIRILLDADLRLDLREALQQASAIYPDNVLFSADANTIADFVNQRLRFLAQDEGLDARVVQAVAQLGQHDPVDALRRMRAVAEFRCMEAAQALAAANKRVANILAKSDHAVAPRWVPELLQEPAEQALAQAVEAMRIALEPLLAAADYRQALRELAGLREIVDRFFDEVLVNHEDAALRDNRLGLLAGLRALFLEVADISCLQAT